MVAAVFRRQSARAALLFSRANCMADISPGYYGYQRREHRAMPAIMPKRSCRPACPKCDMHMIATTEIRNSKQTFKCLRCDHEEIRKVEQ
jgi:hypothetical protein